MEAVFTVGGVIDDVAAFPQAARQVRGGFTVILYNKNSHAMFASSSGG